VNAGLEFPDEFVAACVQHYHRPIRNHPLFAKHRRDGRSFPTDYRWDDEEPLVDHWHRVIRELNDLRPSGRFRRLRQAGQSANADARVFAGPSDADIAALAHIDDALCVAEFLCAELGLRTDTWKAAEAAKSSYRLRGIHIRYGLVLDWATRDVAQRMARERDGVDSHSAYERYGLDPIRVSLEHGVTPDELDEFCARAGLRDRESLWPFGESTLKRPRIRDEWFDPTNDAGYVEIATIKERLGTQERGLGR
jgi:hypothetical protein